MIKTCEFVTPNHPDKICDIIADTILDECLIQDPNSRVAVEVFGSHGFIIVGGEVTTTAFVDIPKIVEKVMGKPYPVLNQIVRQSPEIARGVDIGGAGDQGIMVGYATSETESLMPLEYELARSLCEFIYEKYPFDGKTQVTVEDGKIKSIVASFQNVKKDDLLGVVVDWFMKQETKPAKGYQIYCNPAGDWNVGGFDADTGLTGRKLVVDSYGPRVALGGGSFSGKDSTKVDRSGAYMARKIAVDILKANEIDEVVVRLAYAIGKAEPLQATASYLGQCFNINELKYLKGYDLSPQGIINFLDLRKPQFADTARWGHMGRGFKWDK